MNQLRSLEGVTIETDAEGVTHVTARGAFGLPVTSSYWKREPAIAGRDPYLYKLGAAIGNDGVGPYGHVSAHGCEIMIYKFLVKAGLVNIPQSNDHLDEIDSAYLEKAIAARRSREGNRPMVGDRIIMADGANHVICATYDHGAQTTRGGSIHISRDGYASFSGGLDCARLYEAMELTGETGTTRMWFSHHGMAGAGRGIDCHVPVRVWRLKPDFTMTEAEAKKHPRYRECAAFWEGSSHAPKALADTLRDLMEGKGS